MNRTAGLRATAALLLGLAAGACQAGTIALHLVSHHFGPNDAQERNPGLAWRSDAGATFGVLRNSQDRTTFYGGWTWQHERLALTVGVASGYANGVRPMLVPSVRVGAGFRLALIPAYREQHAALHLMWEFTP